MALLIIKMKHVNSKRATKSTYHLHNYASDGILRVRHETRDHTARWHTEFDIQYFNDSKAM